MPHTNHSTVTPRTGGTVFSLTGELDCASAPTLCEALAALPLTAGELLVIDLTQVSFCDSSGADALVSARNTALARRAAITVTGLRPIVSKVLQITGVAAVLPYFASADEAFEAWLAPHASAAPECT